VVICLERCADCLHGPADATISTKPIISCLQAVLEKRPLNGCSVVVVVVVVVVVGLVSS